MNCAGLFFQVRNATRYGRGGLLYRGFPIKDPPSEEPRGHPHPDRVLIYPACRNPPP